MYIIKEDSGYVSKSAIIEESGPNALKVLLPNAWQALSITLRQQGSGQWGIHQVVLCPDL